MGFAELNALQSNLNSLNNSLSSYSSKLSTQNKRKTKLELLIKDMKKVCNDDSGEVTDYINKIVSNLDEALKGVSSVTGLEADVKSDKEKDVFEDGNMNNALTQLESELRDVNNKITNYESEISRKKAEISNCQTSIRREQRSIAISYKNQYDTAQWKYNQAKIAYEKEPTSEQLRIKRDSALRKRNTARDNYNRYRGWL